MQPIDRAYIIVIIDKSSPSELFYAHCTKLSCAIAHGITRIANAMFSKELIQCETESKISSIKSSQASDSSTYVGRTQIVL